MSKEIVVKAADKVISQDAMLEVVDYEASKLEAATNIEEIFLVWCTLEFLRVRAAQLKLVSVKRECDRRALPAIRKMGKQLRMSKRSGDRLDMEKLGITQNQSKKSQWIAELPQYAFDYTLKELNPSMTKAYRLARKYFQFVEACEAYLIDGKERTDLIKKHLLTPMDLGMFMDILNGERGEDDIEPDEDDMDISIMITSRLKTMLNRSHSLMQQVIRVEETKERAEEFIQDDLDLLRNIASVLKSVHTKVLEMHKDVKTKV